MVPLPPPGAYQEVAQVEQRYFGPPEEPPREDDGDGTSRWWLALLVGLIVAGAIVAGLLLYLLITRTRVGALIRAGSDNREIVAALGINIQRTFAVAFFVGSALAGLGGVVGGSFGSLAPGVDSNWLLNSLVVVIIGGMGSLGGAAIGSLLLGLTTNLSAAYLPSDYNYYSIILTFVLLAVVLAVRPLGIYGRPA